VDKVRLAQLIAIIEPRNWRYDAHGAITCQNDDTSLGDLTEIASALRSYAALREGVPRDAARLHDYPRLLAFFDKYALGPKSKPSCLVCGRDDYDAPPAIQHLELPGIVVCLKCRDAAQEGTP
jgi:hypothetical protein